MGYTPAIARTTSPDPKDPAFQSLRLEDQLCFALYAASRAMTALYRPLLDELGITYPQFLVLLLLWQRSPRTVKEIDAELRLDYGTVSPLLKRLEAAGLVRRERRPEDERSVNVVLTEDGEALRARAVDIRSVVACAAGLAAEDFAALRATLAEVTSTLAAADSSANPV
jgi:MarR family transcriptional regulator, organic hydroperoxide resistance regulator